MFIYIEWGNICSCGRQSNLVLLYTSVDPLPAPDGNLHVYALPVAQGDANVIQCPDGTLTLYDFGTSSDDVDRFWVGPELQTFFGSNTGLITNIIATHQHWDHYRLLPDTFPDGSTLNGLQNIYISCTANDMATTMADWVTAINGDALVRTFNNGGQCGPVGPACGTIDVCPNDAGITAQVMAANLGQHCIDGGNKNMDSIVMKLTHGSVSYMLPGDFEDETPDWEEDGPQKWMADFLRSRDGRQYQPHFSPRGRLSRQQAGMEGRYPARDGVRVWRRLVQLSASSL